MCRPVFEPQATVGAVLSRMDHDKLSFSTISVGIICMSGAQYLARCLDALRAQRNAPVFDVTAVCDPGIADLESVVQRFSTVRIVVNTGQRTPLELASRALRECKGDLILLTKDHCVPDPDWVRTMIDAQRAGRAAVGGRVEIAADASATEWAFHFVDFFRYAAPVAAAPAHVLTVCNVSYQRNQLEAIRSLWQEGFVEAAINGALRTRFGILWLEPSSAVTLSRPITLGDAVYERYAFGRLFGCSRVAVSGIGRRVFYALFAPTLPLLLMSRMASVGLRSRRNTAAFVRSLLPLTLMVIARAWGEWLGYLTGRAPRSIQPAVRAEASIARHRSDTVSPGDVAK